MISSSKKRSYKMAIFFSAQQVSRNSTPTDSALSFCLDKDHWFSPAGLKHIVLLSFQLLEKSEYLPAVLNCRECYAGQWSKRGGTSSESDGMSKFHVDTLPQVLKTVQPQLSQHNVEKMLTVSLLHADAASNATILSSAPRHSAQPGTLLLLLQPKPTPSA